ncbi:LLM class flavin-dependent oxidoreductase [Nocardioides iriomotensis]|uniref:LLM class flavin-dependent oxidoreductase n=1 Tax=Nocardioides iriomotensis TaxID=715784 RepID=A0A4Q5IUD8_9ACTN|nr:LLM class flavin-dependent oxidoreductase [Nocardioides iriomotensis]RYU09323.1 LLM class flavin-dependent oxidoreductase [Nocardioides iriomotensis]
MTEQRLPDPALVVLVGASGSGKSTWAEQRYRAAEVVSSDALRGVVGSGRHDLDASTEAFALLDQIVAGRVRRGLTTVVDTLGLDADRRRGYLDLGRRHGLPTVVVAFDVPPALCRQRNAVRDRPVPAPVLAQQLRTARSVVDALAGEGWDHVVVLTDDAPAPAAPEPAATPEPPTGFGVVLQVSRFPWGEDPAGWLREVALAADACGFAGIALMDHLIQIPQVGTAWEPIPEPWVTLGMLAGLDTRLRLGTLVTPVTFRPPGITAKAAATLDVLSGGRAFVGVGAGWWEREHAGFGLAFPPAKQRLDALEAGIETMRALWAAGTKAYDGEHVALPETTSYPRPVHDIPVVVGGGGERRTLRIAARLGDACNVRLTADDADLDHKVAVLRRHCAAVGRDPAEVEVTVLDLPVVGTDRDDTWERVERLRGRTAAATYARAHHAGTAAEHRERYARLAERGVGTVFAALPDLAGPDDVLRLGAAVQSV